MSEVQEKLLVIQDRDRRIAKMTQESQDVPARKEMIKTRLQDSQTALANAQEEGEALKAEYEAQIGRINVGLEGHRDELTVVILNPLTSDEFYRVRETGQVLGTVAQDLALNGMTPPAEIEPNEGAFDL
ncbi:MAG: hypothetical protein AAF492_33330, partial [Verrucomicrobiota bacterium]